MSHAFTVLQLVLCLDFSSSLLCKCCCKVIFTYESNFITMNHAISCSITHYLELLRTTICHNSLPSTTMLYHALPCATVDHYQLPWAAISCIELPWGTMNCHEFPWATMRYHEVRRADVLIVSLSGCTILKTLFVYRNDCFM